jgi:hypothetical protein
LRFFEKQPFLNPKYISLVGAESKSIGKIEKFCKLNLAFFPSYLDFPPFRATFVGMLTR